MSEIVWRVSSRSGGNGGTCVEVATLTDRVLVRDSKNREGGVLAFAAEEWRAFTDEIHRGGFDL
jgi:hypothetical protein